MTVTLATGRHGGAGVPSPGRPFGRLPFEDDTGTKDPRNLLEVGSLPLCPHRLESGHNNTSGPPPNSRG